MSVVPSTSRLPIIETGFPAARLGYIGSVADVLVATLPEELLGKRFSAAEYFGGFELASPRGKESLGEALIINGICYATSTDRASSDYQQTIFGPEFVTGGMFLIPQGVKPSHKVTFQAYDDLLSLGDLYAELYNSIRQPLAVVGLMECGLLHGTAIGKPPIHGRAIFDHPAEYFPHPETEAHDAVAFVIGVLTDYGNPELSAINKQLEVVLYKNPFDSGSALATHAHVVTLKHKVSNPLDIRPEMVESTLHLFTDRTVLRSFTADIYSICGLTNVQNGNSKETS